MFFNPKKIEKVGFEIRLGDRSRSNKTTTKRFKALYGTYPEVIWNIWMKLITKNIIEKHDVNRLKRFF